MINSNAARPPIRDSKFYHSRFWAEARPSGLLVHLNHFLHYCFGASGRHITLVVEHSNCRTAEAVCSVLRGKNLAVTRRSACISSSCRTAGAWGSSVCRKGEIVWGTALPRAAERTPAGPSPSLPRSWTGVVGLFVFGWAVYELWGGNNWRGPVNRLKGAPSFT